ncbi:MAG TPA: hypothetical protein VFI30_06000 [Nocardioidaceae bacterium]|nr:hypothetical protein [Nocardioidaceae bacterium]
MTTTVRVACGSCGAVELALTAAQLRVPTSDDEPAVVEFACPRCGRPGYQAVTDRGTLLLLRAGVDLSAAQPDQVPGGPEARRSPGR